jgi:anti-sigma factor RsiW
MAGSDPIATLIPWYVNGTLPPEDRRRVEGHLPTCAECRSLLAESRLLEELGREDPEALTEHVQAQHLEQYAVDRAGLDPELASWIGAHVEDCACCAEAARILGRAVGSEAPVPTVETVRPERPARPAPAWLWERLARTVFHPAAAAAYLVVLLLVGPLYRALVHLPDVERRQVSVEERSEPPGGWGGGAVDLRVLSSAVRGGPSESEVVVHVGAERQVVPLGAEFELPDDFDRLASLTFAVRRGDGTVVWSEGVRADRVEWNLRHSGIVTLLVPQSRLPAGSYRLTVERDDRETARPLLDAPFVVARQEDQLREPASASPP